MNFDVRSEESKFIQGVRNQSDLDGEIFIKSFEVSKIIFHFVLYYIPVTSNNYYYTHTLWRDFRSAPNNNKISQFTCVIPLSRPIYKRLNPPTRVQHTYYHVHAHGWKIVDLGASPISVKGSRCLLIIDVEDNMPSQTSRVVYLDTVTIKYNYSCDIRKGECWSIHHRFPSF